MTFWEKWCIIEETEQVGKSEFTEVGICGLNVNVETSYMIILIVFRIRDILFQIKSILKCLN